MPSPAHRVFGAGTLEANSISLGAIGIVGGGVGSVSYETNNARLGVTFGLFFECFKTVLDACCSPHSIPVAGFFLCGAKATFGSSRFPPSRYAA